MQITKIDDLNMNLTILLISNIIIHMNKSKITYGEINDINLKSLLKRLSGI